MPIYINETYPLSADGKEWKHVEGCVVMLLRDYEGYPARRLRNQDTGKLPYRDHKRRRCPVCMPDTDWPESEAHNPDARLPLFRAQPR